MRPFLLYLIFFSEKCPQYTNLNHLCINCHVAFLLPQIDQEKYELLSALSSASSTKGRGHRNRFAGGLALASSSLQSASSYADSSKASSGHTSLAPPSNSEDVSSEESDSDSSYPESNDSDEETSNGSSLKSRPCFIPPPTSSRIKLRGKLAAQRNVIIIVIGILHVEQKYFANFQVNIPPFIFTMIMGTKIGSFIVK